MVLLSRKSIFISMIMLVVLAACSSSTDPTVSGAIVPTRAATASPTATVTPSPTLTASPTLLPSSTPTITPTPTRTIPMVMIGEQFAFTDNDTVTVEDWRVQYTFTGNSGDLITIEMNTDSQRLDPLLVLLDEDGNRLTVNDDATENTDNAAIIDFVLDNDGLYTILATRRGEEDSPYIGDYQLTFLRVPSDYYDPNTGIILVPIPFNTDETGTINDNAPFLSYIVTVEDGANLVLEMTRASGNLDPYLMLVNRETQAVVASNDDDQRSDTTNSYISAENLTAGEYLILATRYQGIDGSSAGDFLLRVSTAE